MRHLKITAAAISAFMLAASPALATTVTNGDDKEHTLTVDRGTEQAGQKIAAGASVQIECPERCGLRVEGSGYGRQAASGDKLVIGEKGMLHFAGEAMTTGSVQKGQPTGSMQKSGGSMQK